jgi:hypothetical protein
MMIEFIKYIIILLSAVLTSCIISICLFDKKTTVGICARNVFKHNISIDYISGYNHELKHISTFYQGAPEKGHYIKYLNKISIETLKILKSPEIRNLIGKTVIFDIDDTLVYTNPINPIILDNPEILPEFGNVYHFPPLLPMLALAKEVIKLGYIVIIITARHSNMLNDTYTNLHRYLLFPDKVLTSTTYPPDPSFKAELRKNLEYIDYHQLKTITSKDLLDPELFKSKKKGLFELKLVMTIGDRWADITGQSDIIGIKLPEPIDLNGYYYYNKKIRMI